MPPPPYVSQAAQGNASVQPSWSDCRPCSPSLAALPRQLTSNDKEPKEVSGHAHGPPPARHAGPRDADAHCVQHAEPHEGEIDVVYRLAREVVEEVGDGKACARERQRGPGDEVARLLRDTKDGARDEVILEVVEVGHCSGGGQ